MQQRQRPRWLDEIRAARASLPLTEPAAARVLDAGAARLEAWQVEPTEYGLLHGDCELDNLVWDGERPQVLDFDSAVYAPYALDIAIAFQDVWQEEGAQRDDHMVWFYAGFSELRPLPTSLREAMPRLLSVLAAFKVATLMRAYATSTADGAGAWQTAPADPADPPWLVSMRTRHRQWLDRQRAALASE
jgi:Ser/Thr protein kinase RdoA (MazF antagonist)